MKPYPGLFYTGDGATHDEHGYIWIKGVAETTVIGTTDELTGQAVFAFATLKP
jgi:acetyl-CoA synthetase